MSNHSERRANVLVVSGRRHNTQTKPCALNRSTLNSEKLRSRKFNGYCDFQCLLSSDGPRSVDPMVGHIHEFIDLYSYSFIIVWTWFSPKSSSLAKKNEVMGEGRLLSNNVIKLFKITTITLKTRSSSLSYCS